LEIKVCATETQSITTNFAFKYDVFENGDKAWKVENQGICTVAEWFKGSAE